MVRRTREVAPARPRRAGRPARPPVPARRAGGRRGPATPTSTCAPRTSRWRSATCTDRSPGRTRRAHPVPAATDEGRGIFPDDDFPGRWFSTWTDERLHDVIDGAGFALDELEVRHAAGGRAGLPRPGHARPHAPGHGRRRDAPARERPEPQRPRRRRGRRLRHRLATGSGRPRSRPGSVSRDRDPRHALVAPRHRHDRPGEAGDARAPTPSPATSTAPAWQRLDRLCAWLQPGAVCFVGLAGGAPPSIGSAAAGWQRATLGGRPVYVMPSTSGLNAATPLAALVDHLRGRRPPALDRAVKYGAAHGRTTGTAGRVHARARPRAELQREHVLQPLRPGAGRRAAGSGAATGPTRATRR